MKIENRVEALEIELKILKSEVQATLLEIREQILNHYYPELRAEEPTRPLPPAKSAESRYASGPARGTGSSAPAAATPPFSDIFLQDLVDEEFDDPIPEPLPGRKSYVMGHVSLSAGDADPDEVERVPPHTRAPEAPRPNSLPAASEAKSVKGNRRAFAALAGWVGDSIAKVGKERTLQVVETYAASNGELAQETRSTIQQLVALADDSSPTVPVSNQEMLGLLVELDEILADA